MIPSRGPTNGCTNRILYFTNRRSTLLFSALGRRAVMEFRTVQGFVLAADVRERAAFWFTTTAAFGVLAGLATSEGVGYVLMPSLARGDLVMVPEYSGLLWLPAVLGASAWGPLAWLNTLYWVILAGLVGKILALLDRRRRAIRRAPARRDPAVPGRDPGPADRPSGRPFPAAGAALPPAPPGAGSER